MSPIVRSIVAVSPACNTPVSVSAYLASLPSATVESPVRLNVAVSLSRIVVVTDDKVVSIATLAAVVVAAFESAIVKSSFASTRVSSIVERSISRSLIESPSLVAVNVKVVPTNITEPGPV